MEAASREVLPSSAEEIVFAGPSDRLFGAVRTLERVCEIVAEDERRAGENLTSWERGLRVAEAGDWVLRRLARKGVAPAEAAATGILARAAHFYDVQRLLHNDGGRASRSWRATLTYEACHFNDRIRRYAASEPETNFEDLLVAMSIARWLVNPSAQAKDSERIFRPTMRGARHELVTASILRCGGMVRAASLQEDLSGVDLVRRISNRRGLPIDVAASEFAVERKCGTFALSGIKKDVLVVSSGLSDAEIGDGFVISRETAESVYNDSIGEIIEEAIDNPIIRRVKW